MSLTNFRKEYAERLLDLLWGQWVRLGVFAGTGPGANHGSDEIVIDPEALLLASLEMGRMDPRLYDEVLSWLTAHGSLINLQRLENVVRRQPGLDRSLLAAPAAWMMGNAADPRWKRLASRDKPGEPERFFLDLDGRPMPEGGETDPVFLRTGWSRGPVRHRDAGSGPRFPSGAVLWLNLRCLFGLNLRADVLVYLLTHASAHPSELAREIHYSQPSLFQVCRELERSGTVQGFRQGNQHRCRLEEDRWRCFLGIPPVRWVGWAAVFHFHQQLWRFFFSREWEGVSAYLQASEFRAALQNAVRNIPSGPLAAEFEPLLSLPFDSFLPAATQKLLNTLASLQNG